jgi:hypothetical protein
MKDKVSKVIKQLDSGFIPDELTYGLEQPCEIDWTALRYNDWDYLDFWVDKQPTGLLEQWPELMEWVISIYESNKNITPLDELEYRQAQSLNEGMIKLKFE